VAAPFEMMRLAETMVARRAVASAAVALHQAEREPMTASPTSEATEAIRVRVRMTMRASAARPTAAAVSDMSPGWMTTLKAFTSAGLPF
jgi:hypothetical protein